MAKRDVGIFIWFKHELKVFHYLYLALSCSFGWNIKMLKTCQGDALVVPTYTQICRNRVRSWYLNGFYKNLITSAVHWQHPGMPLWYENVNLWEYLIRFVTNAFYSYSNIPLIVYWIHAISRIKIDSCKRYSAAARIPWCKHFLKCTSLPWFPCVTCSCQKCAK